MIFFQVDGRYTKNANTPCFLILFSPKRKRRKRKKSDEINHSLAMILFDQQEIQINVQCTEGFINFNIFVLTKNCEHRTYGI